MAPKSILKPGSAVEVSIERGGLYGSWFSGTIVRCVYPDKFLVQYDNFDIRTVLGLHQLRPLPPRESHQEFKSGDKVEAFRKRRWWEGNVTEDLGNGSFRVYFTDSKEMVFPTDMLRVHRQWINQNWVPPITNHPLKNHKVKRQRLSRRNRKGKRDRISELPDSILLHIMSFMETEDAVRTCVLSKRWKDLCKRLTSLTFYNLQDSRGCQIENCEKLKSWVLSSRDHSHSLLNLTIESRIEAEVLYRVMQYALFHNVQQLKLNINASFIPKFDSLPLILSCQSLTSLELSYRRWDPNFRDSLEFPSVKSLNLPALKSLHLAYVKFAASHKNTAEPFSNCHVLNTLMLSTCSLKKDAQVLCISNSTLSSLTIFRVKAYQITLSTPNLTSFTTKGSVSHELFSTCNLSFLREVNIDIPSVTHHPDWKSSIIIRWLQVLANVKILKIDLPVIHAILPDLSKNPVSMTEPPRLVRLESLIVDKPLFSTTSDEEVIRVVEYLLQNTPMPRVDIRRRYH